MNAKTQRTLELDKILAQLAQYADFSPSRELLLNLQPTNDLDEALRRQDETSEARALLDGSSTISVGGARDVRSAARAAERGATLSPEVLLDIKGTLLAGTALKQVLARIQERFPLLFSLAYNIAEGRHIVAAVSRTVDDQGPVLDDASPRLADIRRSLRIEHDRLRSKLQSIVNSGKYGPFLQESLITMRSGRYVIPIKAEARGNVQGIVHDQSSSGATLFVEPLETVDTNNKIRTLEVEEQNEVERILREISGLVAAEADHIVWSVEALAELDAAFAKARYANAIDAEAPQLLAFDPALAPGTQIKLIHARHPLIDPEHVVPIDVILDDDTYMLIITGPNTGGKTVTLKTVGLLTLMAQCGLHIPAYQESTLTVFDSVYADIGDEQSIEQSLSTFSGHLTNIIDILEHADNRSLVLIDELGAGTDPAEGAAIARAILNNLLGRRITTFVATHYPELKAYAQNTPGVRNASVEFNVETLSPTYRLIIGLPGRSNAIAIATRLGLPAEIIDEARSYVGEADLQVDRLLDEIHRTRDEIRRKEQQLEASQAHVSTLQADLHARLAAIEEERSRLLVEAEQAARTEFADLEEEVRDLRRRLRTVSPTMIERLGALADEAETLVADVEEVKSRRKEQRSRKQGIPRPPAEAEGGTPQVGDRVHIPSLGAEGEVLSLDAAEAEVQVGALRVRVDIHQLERRSGKAASEPEPAYDYEPLTTTRPASPGLELQILGMTVDQAVPLLQEYLDRAYLAGLPWCRVVHGKGTGALRKAVRNELRSHPLVKEYRPAPANEGGDGATLVYFIPLN